MRTTLRSDLAVRFMALDTQLMRYRTFWQCQPFHWHDVCWRNQHPDLCAALDQLSLPQLLDDEDMTVRARWLAPWLVDAEQVQRLTYLPRLQPQLTELPAGLSSFVPGRKWQQIRCFEAVTADYALPFMEWCAGKGHLGRLLGWRRQQPVVALEWQRELCQVGQTLARRSHVDQHFVCADVLAEESNHYLCQQQHAVALHACGELHVALLERGVAAGVSAFTLSPCCYHLSRQQPYRPLSLLAQASELQLTRSDLRLAVQETVTAGARERRLRNTELTWRLAFDLLQRRLRDQDNYLPLPAIPRHLLSGDYHVFVDWALELKGLLHAKPDTDTVAKSLVDGVGRLPVVARMEWVRQLFRRPLELWLVLDRACYLEEQGYDVKVSEFCARTLTPRNLLIEARRRH